MSLPPIYQHEVGGPFPEPVASPPENVRPDVDAAWVDRLEHLDEVPAYDAIDSTFAIPPRMVLQTSTDIAGAAMLHWAHALPSIASRLSIDCLLQAQRCWRHLLEAHAGFPGDDEAQARSRAATAANDMQQLLNQVRQREPAAPFALPQPEQTQILAAEVGAWLRRLQWYFPVMPPFVMAGERPEHLADSLPLQLTPPTMALLAMRHALAGGRLEPQAAENQLSILRSELRQILAGPEGDALAAEFRAVPSASDLHHQARQLVQQIEALSPLIQPLFPLEPVQRQQRLLEHLDTNERMHAEDKRLLRANVAEQLARIREQLRGVCSSPIAPAR